MKKVRTVCGDIAPERLGTTMIHEHVAINLSPVTAGSRTFFPQIKDEQLTLENRNLKFLQSGAWSMAPEVMDTSGDDYLKFIVNELKEYKAVGGEALCECSVYGILGRPYEDLVRASEESGVNIVYGVGMYRDSVRPAKFQGKSEDEIKTLFEADIDNGFEETGIKPGFLKATFSGLADGRLPFPGEMDVFRAVARISAERGMPMMVHLEVPPLSGDQILGFAELAIALGADPKKVLFCHAQSLVTSPDGRPEMIADVIKSHQPRFSIEPHQRLLDLGINISFDSFGNQAVQPFELGGANVVSEYLELSAVYELLKLGYEGQIMLGHDFCCKLSAKAYGGYGYTRVPTFVCDMLGQLGFADAAHRMITTNPAEFLAF